MKTGATDIRQIRVFLAVVQSGGFSAAQEILNLAQSTISTEIAALETRLGYKLCRRGRAGFQLTPQGEAFVREATALLAALSHFETKVARNARHGLGTIRLALIDNLVSDRTCPLVSAFDRFHQRTEGRAHLIVDVLGPREIEQGVRAGKIDIGVGIFSEPEANLTYHPLYRERDVLVCGRRHPLYDTDGDLTLFSRIRSAEKVVRSFLQLDDFFFLSDQRESITAEVESIEAAAFLILAGHHIGFLPDHYAARWIDGGDMRVLIERSYTRRSQISMVHRSDRAKMSPLARTMAQEILTDTSAEPMKILKLAH
ncbi:LysR family transcriptional regulator [Ancylobacter terrae]|uniref:LysR family transcriptional regulator n=1 Tax=Ancylobacter sp. sgz301288 TaxID=3342077 RepID=UPI00385F633E